MKSLPNSFYSTGASPAEGRRAALELLQQPDPHAKSASASLLLPLPVDISARIEEPPGLPGRLDRPLLVDPRGVPRRSMADKHGRAGLIHALAHIECNAIKIALHLGISQGYVNCLRDEAGKVADLPSVSYLR